MLVLNLILVSNLEIEGIPSVEELTDNLTLLATPLETVALLDLLINSVFVKGYLASLTS